MISRLIPATGAEEILIELLTNQDIDGSVAAKCQKNHDQMKCQFARVLIRKEVRRNHQKKRR
jgi:hypothetical protein